MQQGFARGSPRRKLGEMRRTAIALWRNAARSGYMLRGAGRGRRAAAAVHDTVGSTIETGISLHFKLCERRNSECTRVFKVPVFAKVMPGVQLRYTLEKGSAL